LNYWLTTHWPPRIDDDPNDVANGVWLPNGREQAGADLKTGDKILVYQARSGRSERRKTIDGNEIVVPCIEGREGIIAVCEAQSEIYENEDSEPSIYVDGSEIWWRWHAPLKTLSKSGFVSREIMNSILGYKPNFNLRGFGDFHSGLKKITIDQYFELLKLFRGIIKTKKFPVTNIPQEVESHGHGIGTGESREHLLLKSYVALHPESVLNEQYVQTIKVEYQFPTGDRADILLEDEFGRVIGMEIEVNVGDNQFEGLLQAIKYRYMSELITDRAPGDSRAILVAYSISQNMKLLCDKYHIQYFEIDKKVVEKWSLSKDGIAALAERTRIDCESEANHDLIRRLNKPDHGDSL